MINIDTNKLKKALENIALDDFKDEYFTINYDDKELSICYDYQEESEAYHSSDDEDITFLEQLIVRNVAYDDNNNEYVLTNDQQGVALSYFSKYLKGNTTYIAPADKDRWLYVDYMKRNNWVV